MLALRGERYPVNPLACAALDGGQKRRVQIPLLPLAERPPRTVHQRQHDRPLTGALVRLEPRQHGRLLPDAGVLRRRRKRDQVRPIRLRRQHWRHKNAHNTQERQYRYSDRKTTLLHWHTSPFRSYEDTHLPSSLRVMLHRTELGAVNSPFTLSRRATTGDASTESIWSAFCPRAAA